MAKRDWPLMFTCGHSGCTERVTYRYSTRRDLVGSYEVKNFSDGRWRCVRHSRPSELLSLDNPSTRHELVVEEKHGKHFFGHSGFLSGPGFKVFADDFPVGTKLIVTAIIEQESGR